MIGSPRAASSLAASSCSRERMGYNTDCGALDSDAARIWTSRLKPSPVVVL
jgi:hypothetical protein